MINQLYTVSGYDKLQYILFVTLKLRIDLSTKLEFMSAIKKYHIEEYFEFI